MLIITDFVLQPFMVVMSRKYGSQHHIATATIQSMLVILQYLEEIFFFFFKISGPLHCSGQTRESFKDATHNIENQGYVNFGLDNLCKFRYCFVLEYISISVILHLEKCKMCQNTVC